MKLITPTIHGVLDYLSVADFLFAPLVFGFSGRAAEVTSTLAGAYLVFAAFTRAPLGLVKLVPFRIHGAIDALVALGLIAAPWLLGFSDVTRARNFFIAAGVLSVAIVLLTDFGETEAVGS